MSRITLGDRAARIARALGNLQDQARAFAKAGENSDAGFQAEQLALAASRFVESVRVAISKKGDNQP